LLKRQPDFSRCIAIGKERRSVGVMISERYAIGGRRFSGWKKMSNDEIAFENLDRRAEQAGQLARCLSMLVCGNNASYLCYS
jgi:hypothetical protein